MSFVDIRSENEYQSAVINHPSTIIIFGAEWSGPWMQTRETFTRIAPKYPIVYLGYVNIDQSPELTAPHGITAIPNTFGYKGGNEVKHYIGPLGENQAEDFFKAVS